MRLTLALVAASALAGCASSTANTPAPSATAQATPAPVAAPAPAPLVADAARHLTGTIAQYQESCQQDIQQGRELLARFKALPAPRDTVAALTLYDDGLALLADTGGRAAVATNSHPDEAMRAAAQDCEQRGGQGDHRADPGPRHLRRALASLDVSQQDAATRHYVSQDAARLPPRRRGQGRGHPRPA